MSADSILLLGLKGSGKTNFLVALDVVLDNQTDADGLVHASFANERAYLRSLRDVWMSGEELGRTSRSQVPPAHQLHVKQRSGDRTASFSIPDLAGETFDEQFVNRGFSEDYILELQQAKGILLFIHCEDEPVPEILSQAALMSPNTEQPFEGAAAWEVDKASKQTKLVDLLQFIAQVRGESNPLRIAVLFSAWDIIQGLPVALGAPKDPERFFVKRWPLLDQYLEYEKAFTHRVFGVSARGGGQSPEEIQRLIALQPPDRVRIFEGAVESKDISRPVRWLLGMLD